MVVMRGCFECTIETFNLSDSLPVIGRTKQFVDINY